MPTSTPAPPQTGFGSGIADGLGVWIWRLRDAENGDVPSIIQRAREARLNWVAIKGGDGTDRWSQLTPALVNSLHEGGLRVLGWVYAYGRDPDGEVAIADSVLGTGCDGLIVDAEAEFEGKAYQAERYMSAIRRVHPGAFIAYSTFPLISKHRAFPYVEFGKYSNASMPQCYWKLIGLTPEVMMERTRQEWQSWAQSMERAGHGSSVVPLYPVGQGFDVDPDEIRRFIRASSDSPGLSLWSWTHMSSATWRALGAR